MLAGGHEDGGDDVNVFVVIVVTRAFTSIQKEIVADASRVAISALTIRKIKFMILSYVQTHYEAYGMSCNGNNHKT